MEEIAEAWRELTADEKIRLVLVHREAARRGLDLLKVGTAAVEAVEPPPESTAPTLKVAVSELCQAKLASGRSRRYVDHLDMCLRRFMRGREEGKIDRLSPQEVDLFLSGISPRSRPNWRAMLATFFSFARRRKWIAASPLEPVEWMKRMAKRLAVFTPEQLRTCLEWLRREKPRALAWFILTTLC